jgi:hypothetical protein
MHDISLKNEASKTLAKSLFYNGELYCRAAYLLKAQRNSDVAMVLPGNVNAALSLELYFNSLFILDRGIEFRIGGRPSHRFDILFEKLSGNTQHSLIKKFNITIKERPTGDILMLEKIIKKEVPRSLKNNLDDWSKIFVELRYVYSFKKKYENKVLNMAFFPEIRSCVVSAILEKEPTWANPAIEDIEDFIPLYPDQYLAREEKLKNLQQYI